MLLRRSPNVTKPILLLIKLEN